MESLEPGDPRRMGDYRLLGRLGAGGMGRVYPGRSRRGRIVAVKLVHAELARDPMFLRRLRREVARRGRHEGLRVHRRAVVRRPVGTETIRISTANGNGLSCDSMATLVSAEREILFFPSRMLTQNADCVLSGLQKFIPQGASGLRWEYTETGEAAALQRA